jgi:hypothetical protein
MGEAEVFDPGRNKGSRAGKESSAAGRSCARAVSGYVRAGLLVSPI